MGPQIKRGPLWGRTRGGAHVVSEIQCFECGAVKHWTRSTGNWGGRFFAWVANAKFTIPKLRFADKVVAHWLYGDQPCRVLHRCQQGKAITQDFMSVIIDTNSLRGSRSGSIFSEPHNGRALNLHRWSTGSDPEI